MAVKAIISPEPLDSESAQELLRAFVGEISQLYPTWTPKSGPSAEPIDFEAPNGTFAVAYVDGRPAGCGGFKRIDEHVAEIKRLYVRPDMRGHGLGRRILLDLEQSALQAGYRVVRLDTGAEQPNAVRLFLAAGYRQIPDYNGNPVASHWFEKALTEPVA